MTESVWYAKDRFEAGTYVKSLALSAELEASLLAAIGKEAATVPLRVVMVSGEDDMFKVEPFDFVQV